ncbi:LOW QUALITY PROTEIN: mucin-4 [Ursus americanus]|uniref:LOW QUALITY PROTEIN: mucin-4 n=1 Tax=Ursus americanus TaxID=9643 RepID=UPI001E67BB1B|nr:LOW QUALITY PROTEIN: mucin-4 [Ursus americanus]
MGDSRRPAATLLSRSGLQGEELKPPANSHMSELGNLRVTVAPAADGPAAASPEALSQAHLARSLQIPDPQKLDNGIISAPHESDHGDQQRIANQHYLTRDHINPFILCKWIHSYGRYFPGYSHLCDSKQSISFQCQPQAFHIVRSAHVLSLQRDNGIISAPHESDHGDQQRIANQHYLTRDHINPFILCKWIHSYGRHFPGHSHLCDSKQSISFQCQPQAFHIVRSAHVLSLHRDNGIISAPHESDHGDQQRIANQHYLTRDHINPFILCRWIHSYGRHFPGHSHLCDSKQSISFPCQPQAFHIVRSAHVLSLQRDNGIISAPHESDHGDQRRIANQHYLTRDHINPFILCKWIHSYGRHFPGHSHLCDSKQSISFPCQPQAFHIVRSAHVLSLQRDNGIISAPHESDHGDQQRIANQHYLTRDHINPFILCKWIHSYGRYFPGYSHLCDSKQSISFPSSKGDISSSSTISSTPPMTSEVSTAPTTTDTPGGNTKHTSQTETGSFSPVTSAVSMTTEGEGSSTAHPSFTSAPETTASSQRHTSQTMETSRESQTSTISPGITSTPSSSASGYTPTDDISQDTATSATASSPSPSSVSHKPSTSSEVPTSSASTGDISSSSTVSSTPPMTSEVPTAPTTTDTPGGNTKHTSQTETGSFSPVTSAVSMTTEGEGSSTAHPSFTSAPETTASSQRHTSQTMETSGESQTSTISPGITSTPSSSASGYTPMDDISQDTATSATASSPSPSRVSHKPSTSSEVPTSSASKGDISSSSTVSSIPPMTSEVPTAPTTTDTPGGNTKHTSQTETGSFSPVTSAVSMTTEREGSSTAHPSFTSAPETTASSQRHTSQTMETSRESQTSTISPGITSTPSSSASGYTPTDDISQDTATSATASSPSPSSVSHKPSTSSEVPTSSASKGDISSSSTISSTPPMTSEVSTAPTTTDTPGGNTKHTSQTETGSFSPVTSAVSMTTEGEGSSTAHPSFTSAPETTASSQRHMSQTMETSRESQTSTISPGITSTPSSSASGYTPTDDISQDTATSATASSPSPSSVSHKPSTSSEVPTSSASKGDISSTSTVSSTPPMTSEVPTAPTTTDTPGGNTKHTSQTETGSFSPVTSAVSMTTEGEGSSTAHPSFTSAPETTASSQRHTSQTMETSRESQTSTISPGITSTPSSSASGYTPTDDISQDTATSATASSPSPSSVSHKPSTSSEVPTSSASKGDISSSSTVSSTPPMTSEVSTAPTTTDTPGGNTKHTSQTETGSFSPVTSAVSMTTEREGSLTAHPSFTSAPETTASSQRHMSQTMETSRESQTSTISPGITSTPSSSASGYTPMDDISQDTATSATASSPSPSSVSHKPSTSSEVPTSSASTGDISSSSTVSSTPPMTSEVPTAPTTTDTPGGNTKHTSQTETGSFSPVTSAVSMTTEREGSSTAHPSFTSAPETTASSQRHTSQTMETSGESQTSTISPGITSTPSSSASGYTPTDDISQDTATSATASSPSPSSVSHKPSTSSEVPTSSASTGDISSSSTVSSTPPMTSEVPTAPTTTDTPGGNTKHTSQTETGSFSPVTSAVSMTTEREGSSTAHPSFTSAPETTASSQHHTTPVFVVTWNSTTLFSGPSTPLSITSTLPPSTASSSSAVKTQTSGTITTSLRIDSQRRTTPSVPSTTSQTHTTFSPRPSIGTHSTAAPIPIKPENSVSLFPYGSSVGDREFVKKTVDFTSPLFKPQIGFPLGSSLRDYLYFTDNGQIIFPKSEYQIFSYPNPPLRGFTGWDPVAMVAPFWDDADFSSGRGTIFYQEYETLYNEYNPLVWQVESWIKEFTYTWNYKAMWTLKVTWVNAPAYPSRWTFGTNTYQAILSTDGSRSYALFLYQSGGMQWDVTQRPGNPVLMGFSSGDGHFENSPLTSQPMWQKYLPDQFLNSNSGLRGLQVYSLHREERPNYRLRCLQWLHRQPQWPTWGWNQISCPCSWQQGLWDSRFQPISMGWWGLGSRQLCSFSSWRGGVCCSYGPWGELLQGWRVPAPWQFDEDLEPQNWCCRWNDKPSFCALYQQRRPRIGCAGYRPPRPAWMFGDPHITTLDGANFTFNGLGDFQLVRAWDGNSSFLLQGRTAQTGSAQATNFIAFAAKYDTNSLSPITVRWLLEPNDTIHVQVNNQTVAFEINREDPEGREIFNTTGIIMARNGSLVSATFDGTVTISVIALSNILHASCGLPEEYRNRTEGLLGVWNDNPDDDFRMPNGSAIPSNSTEELLFQYGMTWEINDTRLLGKRDGHLPANFTPIFLSQLKNKTLDEELVAECNGDMQCLYDSSITGNASTGQSTKVLLRSYRRLNATLNKYPPSIEGQRVVEAYVGQTKQIQYRSHSEKVTFALRHSSADFRLFENGTLLWTPKSLEPFTLEILARNVEDNLSSVLQPKTVVCACKEESQCLYNQTSRVGNSSLEAADCKCDGNNFGRHCESSKNPCDEPCFGNVQCFPGKGCGACPPNLTGDGRHCAALEPSLPCQNRSCPVNYCYNQGHCYISQALGCQPACTCPPAFTDTRCFVAGNNFTPILLQELPVRSIQLWLSEEENASVTDVNASVAYRLRNLNVRAFLRNSLVTQSDSGTTLASGSLLRRWKVISEFQYLPRGPVIDFLNTQLLDAVVEAFLPQASWRRWNGSEGPRTNVNFHSISREDVASLSALNVSVLGNYFNCSSYKDYRLVYSPQGGFTCVSPCAEGYCQHGGQCQHLPQGPRCSCEPFSIYAPWGERCEHLGLKLGAFFGILFGALGFLLLLGAAGFVVLRFWCYSGNHYSYPLDSES